MKKRIIYGCESRGDGQTPYLTRWGLVNSKFLGVYIHRFHRSDAEDHHDHPWGFVSLILWRGYFEETVYSGEGVEGYAGFQQKRVWPGMLLFRRATHRHRVVLDRGREAWTLVVRGPYCRDWGFFVAQAGGERWQSFKDYFKERGC